eukprot:TRINITY_DN103416_c0_g1_i1.p1 TRINITY_DN103416_c0_g1~~TRINITY_DN103416_c0_g1_i1.p1  ORF type:complete len:186 (-),score=22.65 TRINITY_DN103416_c0_g1_i1:378-935(-)
MTYTKMISYNQLQFHWCPNLFLGSAYSAKRQVRLKVVRCQRVDQKQESKEVDAEITTKKYGLEAGLFKALTGEKKEGVSRTQQAKDLLAKYGSAYLITSISFAIVSFGLCYALVSVGVDVPQLLNKVGLNVNEAGEKVGTVAIAYAAHKALSPIRFPPTVALTPVVAKWIGKKFEEDNNSSRSEE